MTLDEWNNLKIGDKVRREDGEWEEVLDFGVTKDETTPKYVFLSRNEMGYWTNMLEWYHLHEACEERMNEDFEEKMNELIEHFSNQAVNMVESRFTMLKTALGKLVKRTKGK